MIFVLNCICTCRLRSLHKILLSKIHTNILYVATLYILYTYIGKSATHSATHSATPPDVAYSEISRDETLMNPSPTKQQGDSQLGKQLIQQNHKSAYHSNAIFCSILKHLLLKYMITV